jgi:hypothetical protein
LRTTKKVLRLTLLASVSSCRLQRNGHSGDAGEVRFGGVFWDRHFLTGGLAVSDVDAARALAKAKQGTKRKSVKGALDLM